MTKESSGGTNPVVSTTYHVTFHTLIWDAETLYEHVLFTVLFGDTGNGAIACCHVNPYVT